MKLISAITRVLQDTPKPLHVTEITKQIIDQKLWVSQGKTPEATIGAAIYSDIKKNAENSIFIKIETATFGLRNNARIPIDVEKTLNNAKKTGHVKSFLDAAEIVLKKYADHKPMHYGKITDIAIEEGWINTAGKTPDATMNAQLITDIKRADTIDSMARFFRSSRGYYGLTEWMGTDLQRRITLHNNEVRKKLLGKVMSLTAIDFEKLVKELLAEMGFEKLDMTPVTSDGGIDITGVLKFNNVFQTKMAVQVKRWKNNVQRPIVQQVRGSLDIHEQGLIVTTSDFSRGAIEEAQKTGKTPIGLMNGAELISLLMKYSIGVKRMAHDIFEISEF